MVDRIAELCVYICCIHTETMKHTRGRYTDNMTDMAGKIVGMMGKDIDNIFQTNIGKGELEDLAGKATITTILFISLEICWEKISLDTYLVDNTGLLQVF